MVQPWTDRLQTLADHEMPRNRVASAWHDVPVYSACRNESVVNVELATDRWITIVLRMKMTNYGELE